MVLITRIALGTYNGNGAATQAIVGVGFQPKHLTILPQDDPTGDGVMTSKTNAEANGDAYYRLQRLNLFWSSTLDHILSFDADGFTVGDGTGSPGPGDKNAFNRNGIVYTYIAMT